MRRENGKGASSQPGGGGWKDQGGPAAGDAGLFIPANTHLLFPAHPAFGGTEGQVSFGLCGYLSVSSSSPLVSQMP